MMQRQPDGTVIAFLTRDMEPVAPSQAEMVKIIKPNGNVTFAYRPNDGTNPTVSPSIRARIRQYWQNGDLP
jgi:hypothetical protein